MCESAFSGTAVANSLTSGLDATFGPRPTALPPGKKSLYPLYRRPGGLLKWFRLVRRVLPPAALEPRIFESAASSYTDCAIPAAIYSEY
jgi:hypothetical protein